jgi:hypothetical protein
MAKVSSGQPLTIAARDWNTLLDVADRHRRGELSALQGRASGAFAVRIRNDTGAAIPKYHACGLGDSIHTTGGTTTNPTWLQQFAFAGEVMDPDYLGRFAVAQETIPDGAIGNAVIDGITVARISVTHVDNDRVDVDTAASPGTALVSAFHGAGEILYRELPLSTGAQWSLIRIGAFVAPLLKAVANEDIAADAAGDVTILWAGAGSQVVEANLNWLNGGVGVSNLDELFIRFHRDENAYVIEGAAC